MIEPNLSGSLIVTEKSISAVKGFMNDWSKGAPAHHCAIGVGHVADKIEKLGSLLGIEANRVC